MAQGHGLRWIFRYESGDHVAVFPTNDSALVNKLGQVLGVDLDVVISLNNLDGTALNPHEDLELVCCHISEGAGSRHLKSCELHSIISVFPCLSHKILTVMTDRFLISLSMSSGLFTKCKRGLLTDYYA